MMKKYLKRGYGLFVVLMVIIGLMPVGVFAENNIYSEKIESLFIGSENNEIQKNELNEAIQITGTEGDYDYIDVDEGVCIVKYSGTGGDVVIPATIAGEQVVEIGDYAFSHFDNIISLVVPDGVEKIGEGAFFDCFF